MLSKCAICLILIATVLLSSVSLSAQGTTVPTSDWASLKAVASGSKLVVKLKNGKTVEGKLSSVSDAALSLTVKNAPVDLQRDEVLSVYKITRKSATKATLIGMGVGAGGGAVIGAAGSASSDGFDKLDQAVTAGLTVIGAGIGALTGYLIGRSGRKRVLIYEAK